MKRIDRTDEKFHKLNELDRLKRIEWRSTSEKWVWGAGAVLTCLYCNMVGYVGELTNLIPDGDVIENAS